MRLIDLEKLADEDLTSLEKQFERSSQKSRTERKHSWPHEAERTALSETSRGKGIWACQRNFAGPSRTRFMPDAIRLPESKVGAIREPIEPMFQLGSFMLHRR